MSEIEELRKENEELKRYKKAAHFHNMALMVESNGVCSLHDTSEFMLRQQKSVYRSISELVDAEMKMKRLDEENEELLNALKAEKVSRPIIQKIEGPDEEPWHVDDFIDYGLEYNTPEEKYARWFFMLARLSAVLSCHFSEWIGQYRLFCTYKDERYRVTGASRMGDIWLVKNFEQDSGYDHRVGFAGCSYWSPDASDTDDVNGLSKETIKFVSGLSRTKLREEVLKQMRRCNELDSIIDENARPF